MNKEKRGNFVTGSCVIASLCFMLLSPVAVADKHRKPIINKRGIDNTNILSKQSRPKQNSLKSANKQPQGALLNQTFSNLTYPRYTGQKTFSVDIKLRQLSTLSATGLKLLVKLHYREVDGGSSQTDVSESIVTAKTELISSSPKIYRATVILPQTDDVIAPSGNQFPKKLTAGKEVRYKWEIVGNKINQLSVESPVHLFVMPRPYTIAIMGDSFGAGEGAPTNIKGSDKRPSHSDDVGDLIGNTYNVEDEDKWGDFADWSDRKAHRSNNSGLLKAVRRYQSGNPSIWIEYIHTAISSATISQWNDDSPGLAAGGMLGTFKSGREIFLGVDLFNIDSSVSASANTSGEINVDLSVGVSGSVVGAIQNGGLSLIPEDKNLQKAQLNVVEEWLTDSGFGCLDTVVMSAGGNDMGFGDLIMTAAVSDLDPSPGLPANALEAIDLTINLFGWGYANNLVTGGIEMADPFVDRLFEHLDYVAKPRRVLWANYPNLTNPQRGTRKHLQTVRLGGQIAGTRVAASTIGAVVGFLIWPLPGPEDVLLQIEAQRIANDFLRDHNLNTAVFALSLGYGDRDMQGVDKIIEERLNPQIVLWCEKEEHAEICEVVDISNPDVLRGHGLGARGMDPSDTERYFNTFIDSYQFACGGLDCSIHPNKEGFEEIYVPETVRAIARDYNEIIRIEENSGARVCDVTPHEDLIRLHAQRQQQIEDDRSLLTSYDSPPPPPPSEKEIFDIARALETNLGGGEYGREARQAFESYIRKARAKK